MSAAPYRPDIATLPGPRYLAIAEAVAADVAAGRLQPGDRLPPQRELAEHFGVTVGTVTRAYAELDRRGLTAGEVGRGTFIRGTDSSAAAALEMVPADGAAPLPLSGQVIDLAQNIPNLRLALPLLAAAMAAEAALPAERLEQLTGYRAHAGSREARHAMALWLESQGVPCGADDVVVTAGAQNGMMLACLAAVGPGGALLVEQLTYPGIRAVVQALGLRPVAVPMDGDGPDPEALVQLARQFGARAFFTMPTLHTPLGVTQSAARRRAIVAAAEDAGLVLIEDELYRFLADNPPPTFQALAPHLTITLGSLSKSVAPGLRIGALVAPAPLRMAAQQYLRSMAWMAGPFDASLAARLIRSGGVRQLEIAHAAEAKAREALARQVLGSDRIRMGHGAYHLWLELPPDTDRHRFAQQLALPRDRLPGVGAATADAFAVARMAAPNALRLCLGGEAQRGRVQAALERVALDLERGDFGLAVL